MVGEVNMIQLSFWTPKNHFTPYWEWEDYLAGMFKPTKPEHLAQSVVIAVSILSSERCLSAMRRVISEWPNSSAQNLHDDSLNRRPWLGRACCCIESGCREDAVRIAWWKISELERDRANSFADVVIRQWEIDNA